MLFEGSYPPGVTGKMIDYLDDGRCCDNCRYYNGDYCIREWNNADESYKLTERDARKPEDYCDYWESESEG